MNENAIVTEVRSAYADFIAEGDSPASAAKSALWFGRRAVEAIRLGVSVARFRAAETLAFFDGVELFPWDTEAQDAYALRNASRYLS